jgi:Flp pilus assembly protein TadD
MRGHVILVFILLSMLSWLPAQPAWSQAPTGGILPGGAALGESQAIEKHRWHIFGRVTTPRGDPVGDARVIIDVGTGPGSMKMLETNFRGEFRTDYSLDARLYKSLSVEVSVNKPGFKAAKEFVDFGASDKTWGIDVVLGEKQEDPDQLSLAALVGSVAPTFRSALVADPGIGRGRSDAMRGAEELLDRHDSIKAVRSLNKVVDRSPECLECRALLGLTLLDAGSWAGATRQFAEAARLKPGHGNEAQRADLLLVLGVLEAWRHEDKKAAGFFVEALKVQPTNPLVLQELGRSLVLQQNWQAADEYLEKAIKQGASPAAHLLRARALLERGEPEEAEVEMKQFLGDKDIRTFPVPTRMLYAEVQERVKVKAYGRVKDVVSQPLSDLYRAVPELKGLAPAPDQAQLPMILQKMGESVGAYFRDFPNTTSLEKIRQEKLLHGGKVKDTFQQNFQYLLLAKPDGTGMGVEEYRTDMSGVRAAPEGLGSGFMLTSGFVSASLYLHPDYQSGSAFRYLGRQVMNGHDTHVVAFAQRPELAELRGRFSADGHSVPILLQGVVWVDAGSFQIVRLRTDLLKPPPKARLEKESTEIDFEQVHFKGSPLAMWLPHEVAVTVEWKGRAFRNMHDYSDFRLFNVDATEKRKATQPAPETPASPE